MGKLLLTKEHACGYLANQRASLLFISPEVTVNVPFYTELAKLGFRRGSNYLYKPFCKNCQACMAVRVRVDDFTPNRWQRRVLRRNTDITHRRINSMNEQEHFALYDKYIGSRHNGGDMYPADRQQFHQFLNNSPEMTQYEEFRIGDQLAAMAVVDKLEDGFVAIYTFYDPSLARRSLGNYCILWLIEETKRFGLQWLYLGDWIKNCRKMAYKIRFSPTELLVNDEWQDASKYAATSASC